MICAFFELDYKFNELPAFTDLGFEVGSFSGTAEIRFDETADWYVGDIWLDGVRRLKAAPYFERKPVLLCKQSHREIFLNILSQLEDNSFKDDIQNEVNAYLDEQGLSFRPDHSEHSTHYAALSGAV